MLRVLSLVSAAPSRTAARTDALGRPRGFPLIGTALALALAAAAGIPVLRHARFEHHLADVASSLAGAKVTIRCETLSQAWTEVYPEAGYVRFGADGRPEPRATITLQTCNDLRSWVRASHSEPALGQVIAVHVLTHESMHLAGQREEAPAECAAVQRDARTAALLGASRERAAALAVTYWRQVYGQLPDGYRSADCAPGGRLDEDLEAAPWGSSSST